MASSATPDYRFLIRAIRPGDTMENVLQMVPGLSIAHQDSRTSELVFTDKCGLVIQGFRGRVVSTAIRFMWKATWQELRNDVVAHLEVPGDAAWVDAEPLSKAIMRQGDAAEVGAWVYGDKGIHLGLENGIAFISVGSISSSKDALEFADSLGLLDDRDRIAMRALERQ